MCIHSHQALPCPQGAPSPPEPQGPPGGLPRLARPRGRPPREAGETEREGSRAAVRDPITLGKMEPSARPPAEERERGSLRPRLGEKTGLSHGNPGCREPHYGNRSGTQSRPFVSGDPGPMAAHSGTNPSQSAPGLRHWGAGPQGAGLGEPRSAAGGGWRVPSGGQSFEPAGLRLSRGAGGVGLDRRGCGTRGSGEARGLR